MLVLSLILNGLVLGSIYALIAVGLSLIFGVLQIVNFAHGQVYALGALAMAVAVNRLGFGYFPGVLLATLMIVAFGCPFYHLLLRLLRPGEFERGIIMTLGVGIVLQNGLLYLTGATPQVIDTEFSFIPVEFLHLRVELLRLIAVGFAITSIAALQIVLMRTRFGTAIRALAQNPEAALVVGIKPARVAGHAVMLGLALTGMAGAVLAPVFTAHPLVGVPILFKVFAIVIIGGLGHLPGAVVASLLIGVGESLAGGLGSAALQDAVVFGLMIGLLQFRPLGIFGKGARI